MTQNYIDFGCKLKKNNKPIDPHFTIEVGEEITKLVYHDANKSMLMELAMPDNWRVIKDDVLRVFNEIIVRDGIEPVRGWNNCTHLAFSLGLMLADLLHEAWCEDPQPALDYWLKEVQTFPHKVIFRAKRVLDYKLH